MPTDSRAATPSKRPIHPLEDGAGTPAKKNPTDSDAGNECLFQRVEMSCFDYTEMGSVHCCAFHPMDPLLTCGLSDGRIKNFVGPDYFAPFAEWSVDLTSFEKTESQTGIMDLAWNVNGMLLAAAFGEASVALWRRNGTQMPSEEVDGHPVWATVWNPFSSTLLMTRDNQSVAIWSADMSSARLVQKCGFHDKLIRDMVWVACDQFVTCSDDGTIKLCAVGQQVPIHTFIHRDDVLTVSWNADLELLASVSRDGALTVWSIRDKQTRAERDSQRPHRHGCITWQPTNKSRTGGAEKSGTIKAIASGLEDGVVAIWNLQTDAIQDLSEFSSSMVWDVSFSPDGKYIASINQQGDLVIWLTENYASVFKCQISYRATKRCLLWNPKGYKIALANPSREIHVIEYAGNPKGDPFVQIL